MFIIPFTSTAATLNNAGGKGTNLAKLSISGFNVPPGFILSTSAYHDYVAENDLEVKIHSALENISWENAEEIEKASEIIRAAFTAGKMPTEIENSLGNILKELNGAPLAVRSSATTEDLPDLSFAGQQDTFLNILGGQQLRAAVVNCWSSLWTARAIGYRMRNGLEEAEVSLAVVIQKMVASEVSGVLFTANPLTGQLNETVIEATLGLGEALVSGQVEPDHLVVDSLSGEVKQTSIGSKQVSTRGNPNGGVESVPEKATTQPCLGSLEIKQLVASSQSIQSEFLSPQDIEWAFAEGSLYILQSRAITSLFPLPEVSFTPLVVWFSFGSVQGLVGPITPLGQDAILNIVARAGDLFGLKLIAGESKLFRLAGERIWIKISDVIRNPLGNRVFDSFLGIIEPSIGQILKKLSVDTNLGAGTGKLTLKTIRRLAAFAIPIFARIIMNMFQPEKGRIYFEKKIESYLATAQIAPAGDRFGRLAAIIAFMRDRIANALPFLLPQFIPVMGPSMASLNLLKELGGDANLALEVTRGLPKNVTTEMDLELWKSVTAIRMDAKSQETFQSKEPSELARLYLDGTLPEPAQAAITSFLQKYGMRGVGEIDFGQPRWREEPTPVMQTLQSYMKTDSAAAPDVVFAKGEKAAFAAIEKISALARKQPGGWLKEKLARAAAFRIRVLMGGRESPKFFAIRTMGIARKALIEVGQEFVYAGTINLPDDLSFLRLSELEELSMQGPNGSKIAPEKDWKALIAMRRANFERELRRHQVPRVLVSDGRCFYNGIGAETDTDLQISGSPVSPGEVIGIVHIVFDPRGTQLAPGEILVCPGTDPAWTPLFMVAGGLITEVGGMMTHGSVVAREYGIPAVVGVDQATTRLKNGQKIKLDGAAGKILVLE